MQGYTYKGKTHVFKVVPGEFGSRLNDPRNYCYSQGCLATDLAVRRLLLSPGSCLSRVMLCMSAVTSQLSSAIHCMCHPCKDGYMAEHPRQPLCDDCTSRMRTSCRIVQRAGVIMSPAACSR